MPAKNQTTRPQHVIDKFVKRHLEGGESVAALAKEAKISKPGFYLWVRKYKEELIEASKRSGMKPNDVEKSDKLTLMAENERLRRELQNARNRLVAYMIKAGEM